MRNYCRFWFADITYQDQGPPVGPSNHVILWDRTSDGLSQQVTNIQGMFANQTTSINDSGQMYVLLDTDQCLYMVQQMGLQGTPPAAQQKDSPRDTWFPAFQGEPDHYHGPDSANPGSDRGATPGKTQGGFVLKEVALLNYLAQIYAVLVTFPNPVPALKRVILELKRLIARVSQGLATQAEIDKVIADLAALGI